MTAPAAARQTNNLSIAEVCERWMALGGSARSDLLNRLHDRFAILGPVEFHCGEEVFDNRGGVDALRHALDRRPQDWSYSLLVFSTALWLWDLSDIAITELNQTDLALADLDEFLRVKLQRYASMTGHACRPDIDLFDVAREIRELRNRVEASYVRCFRIDGGTWERREGWLPSLEIDLDTHQPALLKDLEAHTGVPVPEGIARSALARYVPILLARGIGPAQILVAMAEHLVRHAGLDVDYAIVTAARGTKLREPWTLELSDVFSYVALRPGFEPHRENVRLTHGQIRNAIAQRMRYNVTCRGRNYSPDRSTRLEAQPFQFPDVALMEDAHHPGHIASGIRYVVRAPCLLTVAEPGASTGQIDWRGLADLRLNRTSRREEVAFDFDDLRELLRYAAWARTVVEATYAAGATLSARYGQKDYWMPQGDGA